MQSSFLPDTVDKGTISGSAVLPDVQPRVLGWQYTVQIDRDTLIERLPRLLGVRQDATRVPAVAVIPLRIFFGGTFIYAGLQKLTDPQFFSPTSPGFIGHQMSAFVRSGSPLSGILTSIAIPHAAQFGALIAFCELWVGLSALLGLLTRVGALGGLAISLTLFLTATWTVHPYFLGADLPYCIGWLTLLLAGPDMLTFDYFFFGDMQKSVVQPSRTQRRAGLRSPSAVPASIGEVPRKAAIRGLGTALGVIVGGGVIGAIAKLLTANSTLAQQGTLLAAPQGGAAPANAPAGTTFLGNVKALAINSASQYTDPTTGDPAILIRLPDGKFVSYDAVCTHAGCTVEYDPSQQQLVCPCHGASFDPLHAGAVINGPAQQSLPALQVRIDATGNAYAKSAPGGAAPATRVRSSEDGG
ncbi:MAG: Rieske (2Fe-2S) domain protein [Chloroflexi bacterium]|nr:Rieske (2Fe-2S) domain protein [Chloroflexota bacterium]